MKVVFERKITQDVKGVIENAAAMLSLESAARYLNRMLPDWFIYRGGCHIAIHKNLKAARYAIITE